MTEPLTTEQVRGVLAAACQAIYDAREALSDADRQIGDGDHGVGMGRGFKAAREAVETADLTTVGDAFKAVGSAVMRTSGGASGAVFGTMFRGPSKVLKSETLDGEGLAQAISRGIGRAGSAPGKGKPGDKTNARWCWFPQAWRLGNRLTQVETSLAGRQGCCRSRSRWVRGDHRYEGHRWKVQVTRRTEPWLPGSGCHFGDYPAEHYRRGD